MKKIKIYITTALITFAGLSSCADFLDKEYDASMSEQQVFNNQDNTRGFLANIYTNLPDGF
ncbi:MAG: RagB/SusD family nutrient uptake outer membrane protein, partial [Phocaeicola sp.]